MRPTHHGEWGPRGTAGHLVLLSFPEHVLVERVSPGYRHALIPSDVVLSFSVKSGFSKGHSLDIQVDFVLLV